MGVMGQWTIMGGSWCEWVSRLPTRPSYEWVIRVTSPGVNGCWAGEGTEDFNHSIFGTWHLANTLLWEDMQCSGLSNLKNVKLGETMCFKVICTMTTLPFRFSLRWSTELPCPSRSFTLLSSGAKKLPKPNWHQYFFPRVTAECNKDVIESELANWVEVFLFFFFYWGWGGGSV